VQNHQNEMKKTDKPGVGMTGLENRRTHRKVVDMWSSCDWQEALVYDGSRVTDMEVVRMQGDDSGVHIAATTVKVPD
jgi:hypothetical protein